MKLLVLVLAAASFALVGCGDDDPSTIAGSPDETTTTTESSGSGTVAVSLEPVEGMFTEGFEIGLRFETADGEVLDKQLWTDFVQSLPDTASGGIDAYYKSVLEQPVPAGDVVVLASVAIGMGPGPVPPDLDGDLDCRLPVTVPPDGRVEVQVSFDSSTGDCLTLK
jgi:hypothetical protein